MVGSGALTLVGSETLTSMGSGALTLVVSRYSSSSKVMRGLLPLVCSGHLSNSKVITGLLPWWVVDTCPAVRL